MAAAKLLREIFTQERKSQVNRRSQQLTRLFAAIARVRRLVIRDKMLGPKASVHQHARNVYILKHYPLSVLILQHICHQDVYSESQAEAFKALETNVLQWLNWQRNDTQVIYVDGSNGPYELS